MPRIFLDLPGVGAVESTRQGGVSSPPYGSLNLGTNTADTPANITANRRHLFQQMNWPTDQFAGAHQIHSNKVWVAEQPGMYDGYDALITQQAGLAIGVTVADCCPILVYDPVSRSVAAIHAGWKGTVAQIVTTTLRKMVATFGARPEDCHAYVGTCISADCYEVGEEVARHFQSQHKAPRPEAGKWQVALRAANTSQLMAMGVPRSRITQSAACTYRDADQYFSYRRDGGHTGRMLVAIRLSTH